MQITEKRYTINTMIELALPMRSGETRKIDGITPTELTLRVEKKLRIPLASVVKSSPHFLSFPRSMTASISTRDINPLLRERNNVSGEYDGASGVDEMRDASTNVMREGAPHVKRVVFAFFFSFRNDSFSFFSAMQLFLCVSNVSGIPVFRSVRDMLSDSRLRLGYSVLETYRGTLYYVGSPCRILMLGVRC